MNEHVNRAGKQQGKPRGCRGSVGDRAGRVGTQALLGLPDLPGLSNNLTEKIKFERH